MKSPLISLVMLLGVVLGIVLAPSCSERAPLAPPDNVYTLRGRITGLPNPPSGFLAIEHEVVPDFADASGKVIGMESMEMHFPTLGPDASLKGLAVGDPVEAVMEMRWKSEPRFRIVSIHKLPGDFKLNLGEPDAAPTDDPPAPR